MPAAAIGAPGWQSNYEAAKRQASRERKPLVIDFAAEWCGPCKEMEKTTFQDAAVKKLLTRTVAVHVDIDRNSALAKKFGVSSIPRLILLDAKGRRMMDALGYRPAEQFREELADALHGKAVLQDASASGAPAAPALPKEIAALQAALSKNGYAAWRSREPALARRAAATLVSQLASFGKEEQAAAGEMLGKIGEDAVDALVVGLASPTLAVRSAAHDSLLRLLETRYRVPVVSVPKFDPWAAASERRTAARKWSDWWAQQRKTIAARTL